MSVEVYTKEP